MNLAKSARRLLRWVLVRWARGRWAIGRAPEPKVTFLLMHAWSMGGTVRTTLNTASHLARSREVEVLSVIRPRDRPFFEVPPGVTLTAIDDRREGVPRGRLRRALERRPSVLFPQADPRMRTCTLWTDVMMARALRGRRSGVLIGTRPGLNLLASNFGSPSLVTVGQEHMHLGAHKPRLRKAIRAGYPKLDAVAVLTEADRSEYGQLFGSSARVEHIPNAVTELGGALPDLSAKTVIAAGRLTRQKNFAALIRAFAQVAERHPDWQLRICGGGRRWRALKRVIAKQGLGDQVELTGRVQDLGEQMATASIYALSSRREGFPMVLLEAMSKGLPAVAFDCPTGPREIVVDRENGLLVPHQDVAALAAGINEMIEDEALRRRCGAGARATAERYSLAAVGARWESLLAELSSRPAHASRSSPSHSGPITSIE